MTYLRYFKLVLLIANVTVSPSFAVNYQSTLETSQSTLEKSSSTLEESHDTQKETKNIISVLDESHSVLEATHSILEESSTDPIVQESSHSTLEELHNAQRFQEEPHGTLEEAHIGQEESLSVKEEPHSILEKPHDVHFQESSPRALEESYDNPKESYNIMMLLPLSSRSHRTLFLTLAETLAERGHKIELLVNHPPKITHPNIREVHHGLPHFKEERFKLFTARDHPWEVYELLMEGLPAMTRELYKSPGVKDLYNRRKEFDLIIIDNFYNQMMYPFAHELPLVTMQASSVDPIQSAIMGNVLNPSYVPALQVAFSQPMDFWQRALNTLVHIISGGIKQYIILPKIQDEISKLIPDAPSLREIERNQSLTLLNYCYSFEVSLPLLPCQLDIGALHCRPGQPLPEELEDWLQGAGDAGVVYFSLGTVAMGTSLPSQWRQMFVSAFSKLKQRVVWKYEGELDWVPGNVLTRKFLPQQDLLAHSQVKLFISHAGMLSIQEAIYHATPVLAIPILADQPKNARNIHEGKLGISLVWEDLSEDLLLDSITTIIESEIACHFENLVTVQVKIIRAFHCDLCTKVKSEPSPLFADFIALLHLNKPYCFRYAETMKYASVALRDQPETPRDRAAFWTEYIIRHRGAPHLRTPAAGTSWVEFLLIDVVALYIFITFIFIVLSYFGLKWILKKCQSPGKTLKKD